ncbi:piggyBac transposable element-derived protein 4 [Trichonephila clavipes]|nr:piggyBac transposable element-derived protein 4 [Trichonephila clavipes]
MEIIDGIDDENTFLLDDELHSDTDTDISSNYLDYSSDDLCSELSSDEDLSSARIFTEVDVKNPPIPCPRFKFSGIPSVHVQFNDTSDVVQFYETFIDFSLMSKIVEETNKYANQCIQSSVARQFSKCKFWVETTVDELHVFFALNIFQGIVKKPGIDRYWRKRYSTNTPFFSKKSRLYIYAQLLVGVLSPPDKLLKIITFQSLEKVLKVQ